MGIERSRSLESRRGNDDGTRQEDANATREIRPDVLFGRATVSIGQPATREGQAGSGRKSERPIVPSRQGNACGGKGPRFQTSDRRADEREIGDERSERSKP
jgi:hypothetical protein